MFPLLSKTLNVISMLILLGTLAFGSPVGVEERQALAPAIDADWADPAIWNEAGAWYTYATNSAGKIIQVGHSNDFETWTISPDGAIRDPQWPLWVDVANPNVWAPSVMRTYSGEYILYYSASHIDGGLHCVGAAVSTDGPEGNFVPQMGDPLFCDVGAGGAIDAQGFRGPDGQQYVMWKVDGNSLGGGGACGDGDESHPTPLMMVPVGWRGLKTTGDAFTLFDHNNTEFLVEAPSMATMGGKYVLFFSSSCYNTDLYNIQYAVAEDIHGPYIRAAEPLAVTGTWGLIAPGGASVTWNGQRMVFHAGTGVVGPDQPRKMYTRLLSFDAATNIVTAH